MVTNGRPHNCWLLLSCYGVASSIAGTLIRALVVTRYLCTGSMKFPYLAIRAWKSSQVYVSINLATAREYHSCKARTSDRRYLLRNVHDGDPIGKGAAAASSSNAKLDDILTESSSLSGGAQFSMNDFCTGTDDDGNDPSSKDKS